MCEYAIQTRSCSEIESEITEIRNLRNLQKFKFSHQPIF